MAVYYDGSETENDTWYNQSACLSVGCYAFEAMIVMVMVGMKDIDISSVNSDVDFGISELSIELESDI